MTRKKKTVSTEDVALEISDRMWDLEEAAREHTSKPSRFSRGSLLTSAVRFTQLIRRTMKREV